MLTRIFHEVITAAAHSGMSTTLRLFGFINIFDKVEGAYQSGSLLEKRRALMEAWARYCCDTILSADVISESVIP